MEVESLQRGFAINKMACFESHVRSGSLRVCSEREMLVSLFHVVHRPKGADVFRERPNGITMWSVNAKRNVSLVYYDH